MVRKINCEVHCESDLIEAAAPYLGLRYSKPAPSLRDDLVQAFLRFRRANKRLGFQKLLAKWVARRIKLNLKVDYIDPEDKEPSEIFTRILKASFEAARQSS